MKAIEILDDGEMYDKPFRVKIDDHFLKDSCGHDRRYKSYRNASVAASREFAKELAHE